MDDNKNKPTGAGAGGGARDISDLKARLGMKKAPAGVPAPGVGVPAPIPAPSGAAPSPVAQGIPAPIPAPPGFPVPASAEPAAPAQPQVDPRRDPFAASAPAAPPAYYGYAPIPGIDDGKPAEQINKPKAWGPIVGAAGVGLVLLIAGFALGKIQWARANMNKTIDQASDIKVEVTKMAKTLEQIAKRINESQEAAKNNPDPVLAADLGSLDLKKPDTEKIFKTNYYYLDDLSIDRLFNYYNDTMILYGLIAQNAKRTEADKAAIESFVANAKAGNEKNYGFTVDVSSPIPKGHLAEINGIQCPTEGDTNCAPDVLKLKYRSEPGGAFSAKPVKGALAQIIIPLEKSALSTQAMAGNPDLIAAKEAAKRQAEIRLVVQKLVGEEKELTQGLDKAADKGRKVNEYVVF